MKEEGRSTEERQSGVDDARNTRRRIAGAMFFIAASQFLILVTVAESLYPGYSVRDNFLSDLGIVPQSAIVWAATIFTTGALFVVGSYFYFRGDSHVRKWIVAMYLLGGIGLMGTGLFDESAFPILHQIVSLMAFVFGGIAAIASYKLMQSPFKYFSVVLGTITLVSLILLIAGFRQVLGNGLMERLVAFPEVIWLITFGGYLMGSPQEST